MKAIVKKLELFISDLREDESGATMIEYSLLIGLITAAVVAAVIIIGGWAGTQWTNLQAALGL